MWPAGAPNWIVPTAPAGDSSKRAASTEFVTLGIAALSSFISTTYLTTSVSATQTEYLAGGLGNPAVQSYRIVEKLPYAVTLTEFVGQNSTGTLTAVLKINTATVTGGTLAIGTSQVSTTPSALHTAAAGSAIVLTLSVVTSAQNLSFVVKYTRLLS